jgi:bacillopeptidase F
MAAMGIVNYFSAGNDGQFGVPGTLGSPASSPYVISVGATDRNDKPTDFSSRGPNPLSLIDGEPSPFIAGPGQDVRGAVPGGGYEREWQGTSMSAPLISGVGDLINEAALKTTGYKMDVRGHKEVLKRIAEDVGPKGPDTGTGYGIPVIKKDFLDVVGSVAQDLGLPVKVKETPAEPAKPAKGAKPAPKKTKATE